MPETVGPHLLGWRPAPPDERDWKLAEFLADPVDLYAQALTELRLTVVGYQNRYWTVPPANSHWAKALALLAQIKPPAPPPGPATDVIWMTTHQLDQDPAKASPPLPSGASGHCVGLAWADFANALPVDDGYTNNDGHAIYYEACAIGGYPNTEDGSTTRDGAKAMQARGRIGGYAFADTVDDVIAWLRKNGPVVTGTEWDAPMFNPDSAGYVKPNGDVAGGHEWLLLGHLLSEDALLAQNSWGMGWGLGGKFKIKVADYRALFARQGDAVVALELPR